MAVKGGAKFKLLLRDAVKKDIFTDKNWGSKALW